ncbi:MAG TPA: AAA family ATPase [Candidatus Pacearchaeota archaeon]|nr:AAA family ATPase [Candidatus Pacearchaeota archaeon]HOS12490.1 AAA family ATPase [Candidatus Pacearchaeota archaeon]
MRITNLKLKNFMNVSECDLHFKKSINIISGKNGAGKSTIFSAIAFVLEDFKRGDSWKEFIKIGEKDMEIHLELIKFEGDAPIVFDYAGSVKSNALTKEIRYKDEYYKNSQCAEFLSKHFDSDILSNVVLHLQDSASLNQLTPAQTRDLFKKTFFIDFSEKVEKIKEFINNSTSMIKGYETEIALLSEQKYELKSLYPVKADEEIKIVEKTKEQKIKEKEKLLEEKGKKENEIKSIQFSIDSAKNEIKDLESQKNLIESELESLKDSGEEEQIKIFENEIKELNQEIEKSLQKITELETSSKEYKKQIEELDTSLTSLNSQKDNFLSLLNLYDKYLTVLSENSKCPVCGQNCDEGVKKQYEEMKASTTPQYAKVLEEIKIIQNNKKEKQDIFAQIEIDLKNLNYKKINMEHAIEEKKLKIAQIIEKIQTKKEKKPLYENQLNLLNSKISQNKEKLDELLKQNEKTNVLKEELTSLQSNITIIADSIASLEKELLEEHTLRQLNEEINQFNKSIKEKQEKDTVRLNNIKEEKFNLEKKIADSKLLIKILETDLPNFIMVKSSLNLEQAMNSFIHSINPNFQVHIDLTPKGIEFLYKARNESEWLRCKMASGFESALITIAFKFCIAKKYNSKFIIFDEPDKSADDTSSLSLFKIIAKMQNFDQIFITSHRESVKEYINSLGFNTIEVNNGMYSMITG